MVPVPRSNRGRTSFSTCVMAQARIPCRNRHALLASKIEYEVIGHVSRFHEGMVERMVSQESDAWIAEMQARRADVVGVTMGALAHLRGSLAARGTGKRNSQNGPA